ncbi:hypothetical protein SAMN05216352_10112 [Alteribacillus bidgolensis]|uniref:Uncharacterized protein n=1 Tax=Alteribacillus bidgolensis TaxID=930129 RepID=A0A1G8BM47_9BACI|nr:hypothetical protein SAMN05216352_10112 [Alteribacillus bidgolensis]
MYYENTPGNFLSLKEKVDVIRKVAVQQGLNPGIFLTENNSHVTFRIYNCPYKGLTGKHATACIMQ